jgi:hypothetical protein
MAAPRSQAASAQNGRAEGYKTSGRERGTRRLSQYCRGRGRPQPARLDKVENQLDRFRAEEFWDRVMQEIAELIAERGPLTPAEILPGLRAVTLRGTTLHKEHLTPGTLKKKMDVRVFHGRYFEPLDEGRYARKAG